MKRSERKNCRKMRKTLFKKDYLHWTQNELVDWRMTDWKLTFAYSPLTVFYSPPPPLYLVKRGADQCILEESAFDFKLVNSKF